MLNPDVKEKIFYYKNVIKNTQSIIDDIENENQEWQFCDTKPNKEEPYTKSSHEFADYKNIDNVYDIVWDCIIDYSIKNNISLKNFTKMIVTKSYPGKHMGSHTDSYSKNSPDITIMIDLNDDFKGGELVFENQNTTIKPIAGSVLIYPSTDPYYHYPNLIESGNKMSCIMFGFKNEDN